MSVVVGAEAKIHKHATHEGDRPLLNVFTSFKDFDLDKRPERLLQHAQDGAWGRVFELLIETGHTYHDINQWHHRHMSLNDQSERLDFEGFERVLHDRFRYLLDIKLTCHKNAQSEWTKLRNDETPRNEITGTEYRK